MSIGVIGQGFVGTAVREGLKNFYPVFVYDIKEGICPEDMWQPPIGLVQECEIIFQCLPTPMKKAGACDLSIVEKSLKNVNLLSKRYNKSPIIVVKSTVPPGTCERFNQQFENINIVFSPEFLTETNSIEDFKNQTRIILGGQRPYTTQVKTVLRKAFPHIPIIKTGYKTAEMVKYFTNCFLTSKVIFANQMFEICESANIDYDKVTEYVLHDERIGKSHLSVPGPDGDRGYGGHCFPKDLAAMINFAVELEVDETFLLTIEEMNKHYRTNRDWEKMKGRAVSDED